MGGKPYVTVTSGLRGFYAVLLTWSKYEDGCEMYEPEMTGFGSYPTKDAAVHEAVAWAQAEGVSFKLQGYDAEGNKLS